MYNLKQIVSRESIDNVVFLSQLSKVDIMNLLSQSDLCIQCTKNSPIYKFGIASIKLFDYFLSSKPILHCYSGKYDPVKLYNAGISIDSDEPHSIAKEILLIRNLSQEERDELGRNGFKAILKTHNYNKISRIVESKLTQL